MWTAENRPKYNRDKLRYPPLTSAKFDVIVCNPPFVPLPHSHGFHVAGHGGPDGLAVIRRVLVGLNSYLRDDGALIMCCLSLMREGLPHVLETVKTLCPDYHCDISYLYKEPLQVKDLYGCFSGLAGSLWLQRLRNKGFDSVCYVQMLVSRAQKLFPSIQSAKFGRSRFSGDWCGRLKRYEHWNSK